MPWTSAEHFKWSKSLYLDSFFAQFSQNREISKIQVGVMSCAGRLGELIAALVILFFFYNVKNRKLHFCLGCLVNSVCSMLLGEITRMFPTDNTSYMISTSLIWFLQGLGSGVFFSYSGVHEMFPKMKPQKIRRVKAAQKLGASLGPLLGSFLNKTGFFWPLR